MSGPNELLECVTSADKETAKRLNIFINSELEEYDKRTKTLWLFMLATEYYKSIDAAEFEMNDYQLAADMVIE